MIRALLFLFWKLVDGGKQFSLHVFFVNAEHNTLPGDYYTNFNDRWGILRCLFSGEA